jgi:transcriptional regulator with XRE-family HTH domain
VVVKEFARTRIQRIKEKRTLAEVPQFKLAKLSGVGRTKLSLAENEHIQLSNEELDALESALGRAISFRAEVLAGAAACRSDSAVTAAHAFEEPETT